MTNVRKNTGMMKRPYTATMPERYGGNLFFRVRYLESRWIRFVFHTLVTSVAVMLVMTAVAGRVDRWQTEYRQQNLNRIETQLTLCSGQQMAAELKGDLTGQAVALERQVSLLQQKQQLLTPSVPSAASEPISQELMAVMAEKEGQEKALEQLWGVIADTYDAAKSSYGQGNALEALRLFRTVGGYEDSDGWQKLCGIRIHREIERYLSQNKTLTAWVQQMRLLQELRPQKAAGMPVFFGPLRGIWICRGDQQVHMQTRVPETGDGRAGENTVSVQIRCLMAKGDLLYGHYAQGIPTSVSEEDFSTVLCRGGVSLAEIPEDSEDPASAVLAIKAQGTQQSGAEQQPSKIRVISENIIALEEGGWKGIYYRVLGTADSVR